MSDDELDDLIHDSQVDDARRRQLDFLRVRETWQDTRQGTRQERLPFPWRKT